MLLPMLASADAVEISGIYYNLDPTVKEAEVTSHPQRMYSGTIVIPISVEYNGVTYDVISIGNGAFADCRNLTSITIPNCIKTIKGGAFYNCYRLRTITIPSSVTTIGNQAFSGCSGLDRIIVEIGNSTYDSRNNCNAIINTTTNELIAGCRKTIIPDNVTSIGDYAFSGCGLTAITIPNCVISIGNSAFSGCSLTSITIPNNVTSIGRGAFQSCRSLSSVDISNSVTSIEDQTFYDCNSLVSVTIPNSVSSIGDSAFGYCSSLTSITIPNSVTSISSSAFKGTAWFSNQPDGLVYAGKIAYYYKGTMPENTSIVFDDGTIAIADDLFSGCNNLISVIIPNSVISIGQNSFKYCSGLTSAIIGNSVTSIGDMAFYYCKNLESLIIGNSVRSIERHAFDGCEKLTSITFPSSLQKIGGSTFQNCKKLTSINIPEGVYLIGTSAFNVCSSITELTLPNTLTYLGTHAFYGCTELRNITSNIRRPLSINHEVFMESTYTNAELKVPYGKRNAYQTVNGWNQFNNIEECDDDGQIDDDVRTIHVPEAGTLSQYIPDSEKYNIYDLTLTGEINGTDLRLLRDMAGHNYKGFYTGGKLRILDLSKVRIISGGEKYLDTDTLHTSPYSFNNMEWDQYSSGAFRLSVEKNDVVPKQVFSYCLLNELSLPESALKIDDYAFYGCYDLKKVIITDNITSISRGAFSHCSSLNDFTLPNALEEIDDWAFNSCGVTSIEFPAGLKFIGENAFAYCNNLASVVSKIQNPFPIGRNIFPSSVLDNATLTIPVGTKADYLNSEGWNLFKDIVEVGGISSLVPIHVAVAGTLHEYISDTQKYGVDKLTLTGELNGTDLRLLRDMAGCNYLGEETKGMLTYLNIVGCRLVSGGEKYLDTKSVAGLTGEFSYSLETSDILPPFVFAGCKMKETVLPLGINSIGEGAFYGCDKLISSMIPNGVESIGKNAYSNCRSLQKVIISSGVNSIGEYAFYNCDNLEYIASEKQVPFEINDNTFSPTACKRARLNVFKGLKEIYLSTTGWDKFNHVVEKGNKDESSKRFIHVSIAGTLPNYISDEDKYSIDELFLSGELNGTDYRLLRDMAGCDYQGNNTSGRLKVLDLYGSKVVTGGEACIETTKLGNYTISPILISKFETEGHYPTMVFAFCTMLESIILPNNLNIIGLEGFEGCSALSNIEMPQSVTEIGQLVFRGCNSLSTIKCHSKTPIKLSVFGLTNECFESDIYSNAILMVPYGSLSAYRSSSWRMFENIVEMDGGDINEDGIANISDIVDVMNYIMGNPSDILDDNAADLNGDGVVDSEDIVMIVNIIMGK